MADLKNCPFCGKQAHLAQLKQGNWPRFTVRCGNNRCIASEFCCFGKMYFSEQDAENAWNRRASDGKA